MLQRRGHWLLLIFFTLVLFIPGIAKIPAIDRDEAHFAQATRQMLESGNFFQIRFQDKTRFQKPPGINWLQALSVKILSGGHFNNIWPYRIPSLINILFVIFSLYFFTAHFFSDKIGLIASLLLGSSLLILFETHMAVIDIALLFAVTLMQCSLWMIYCQGKTTKKKCWAFIFWLAMAYGILLKGVTPLTGLSTITFLVLFDKDRSWLRDVYLFPGMIFVLMVTFAWLLPVDYAEQSNYLYQMVQKDLLPKLRGGHESHGLPPLSHLLLLPVTFWPASLFLWPAGLYAFRQRDKKEILFLLAWILPTWIFFEFMPTKLPQYVLPVFPAIAILLALSINNALAVTRHLKILQALWWLMSLGIALFFILVSNYILHRITLLSFIIAVVILIFSTFAVYYASHGFTIRACCSCIVLSIVVFPLVFTGFLPSLKPVWISKNIVEVLEQKNLLRRNIVTVGFDEPSLVFNLQTTQVIFADLTGLWLSWQRDKRQLAVIEKNLYNSDQLLAANSKVVAELSGFNYSKGRWLELLILQMNEK